MMDLVYSARIIKDKGIAKIIDAAYFGTNRQACLMTLLVRTLTMFSQSYRPSHK